MEEDIKILEEIVEIYYDCVGNKEQDYDMRVDMGFMKKETQALENLIKGYRELEEENNKFRNGEIVTPKSEAVTRRRVFNDLKNYIPKSKIKEILGRLNISDIEPWSIYKVNGEILFDLEMLYKGYQIEIDTDYIPKSKIKEKIKELYEDKDSKYYDMFLEQRDIEKTISVLQELMEDK